MRTFIRSTLFVIFLFSVLFLMAGLLSVSAQVLPSKDFKKDGLKIVFYEERDGKQVEIDSREFANEEILNEYFDELSKHPKIDVTSLIFNPKAKSTNTEPRYIPSKVVMLQPVELDFVARPGTAKEIQELDAWRKKLRQEQFEEAKKLNLNDEQMTAHMKSVDEDLAELMAETQKSTFVDRKETPLSYLGTIPYPDPVFKPVVAGSPDRIELMPTSHVYVFKDSKGELTFVGSRGTDLTVNPKWVKKDVLEALEADLKKNVEDPTKMKFKFDKLGNLVDTSTATKTVVIRANPQAQFGFAYGIGSFFDEYNVPLESKLTAKEFIEAVNKGLTTGDIKSIEAFVERKDGSEEILGVDEPKAVEKSEVKPEVKPETKPATPTGKPKKDQRK